MIENTFKARLTKWFLVIALIIIGLIAFRSCYRKEVAHKKVYYIGRDSSWYPLKLYGKEKNLQAFTNDLMTTVSKDLGVHFQWADASPNNLLDNLDNENDDAIVSTLRPNAVTKEHYFFSRMIIETGPVLIVRENSPYTSLKDLKDKEIGTVAGSPINSITLRDMAVSELNIAFRNFSNANKAIEALVQDRIDGVIMDAIPAYTFAEGFYESQIKIVTTPFSDEGLRLVALKNSQGELLISDFDKILEKLKKDGTYDQLIEKWELIDPEKRFSQDGESPK